MKKIILLALALIVPFVAPASPPLVSQAPQMATPLLVAQAAKQRRSKSTRSSGSELGEALKLAREGNYPKASEMLFRLSLDPKYRSKRTRIKYILGLMLYHMKLYQVSAFQFISVIREGNTKFLKESLEKLSLAADALGDDTLLNYAISRAKAESFPRVHRDMLFYRIGEFQVRQQLFKDAARSFDLVKPSSPFYSRAKYQQGFAYAKSNEIKDALKAFEELMDSRIGHPVTDPARVSGMMGKARVLYQMKDWEAAVEAYRSIPRDTDAWHDTIFESSWAMLRSGRFRSALSNFQSLHSPYYEDTYLPESLLLRGIVYLYICQYDEMDKVLNMFDRIYDPVYQDVSRYLDQVKNSTTYLKDMVKALKAAKEKGFEPASANLPIPYIVARRVAKEGDFQRSYDYIKQLLTESRRMRAQPASWRQSGIGKYAERVLKRRIVKARTRAGRQVRSHMVEIRQELIDLIEQKELIYLEMVNGRKQQLEQKVAGKDLPSVQVDEDNERDYYIQNGYEYWPFKGEYWLDELGNYHYVGTRSCQ